MIYACAFTDHTSPIKLTSYTVSKYYGNDVVELFMLKATI